MAKADETATMPAALVTGGTGFIGRRLVRTLCDAGWKVTIWCLPGETDVPDPRATMELWPEFQSLVTSRAIADLGKPTIFHLASAGVTQASVRTVQVLWRENVVRSAELMEAAVEARAAGVVYAGSYSEYGRTPTGSVTTVRTRLDPSDLYGQSKVVAGGWLSASARAAGMGFGWARIFAAYGPGEVPTRLLPHVFRKCKDGGTVPLTPGLQVRDWTYVDDVCTGLASVGAFVRSGGSGEFNICTGVGHTVRECVTRFAEFIGADPAKLAFGALESRPAEAEWSVGDPAPLQALGWQPKWSVNDGLREFAAYLQRQAEERCHRV